MLLSEMMRKDGEQGASPVTPSPSTAGQTSSVSAAGFKLPASPKFIPNYNLPGSRTLDLYKDKEGKPIYDPNGLERPWGHFDASGSFVHPKSFAPRDGARGADGRPIALAQEEYFNQRGMPTAAQYDTGLNTQIRHSDSALFDALDRMRGGQMTRNRILNREIDQRRANWIAVQEAEANARMEAEANKTAELIRNAGSAKSPATSPSPIPSRATLLNPSQSDALPQKPSEQPQEPAKASPSEIASLAQGAVNGTTQLPEKGGFGVGDAVGLGLTALMGLDEGRAIARGIRGVANGPVYVPAAQGTIPKFAGSMTKGMGVPTVAQSGLKTFVQSAAKGGAVPKSNQFVGLIDAANEIAGSGAYVTDPNDISKRLAVTKFGEYLDGQGSEIGVKNGTGVSRANNYMNDYTAFDDSNWGKFASGVARAAGAGEGFLNAMTAGLFDMGAYSLQGRPNESMAAYAARTGRDADWLGIGAKVENWLTNKESDEEGADESIRKRAEIVRLASEGKLPPISTGGGENILGGYNEPNMNTDLDPLLYHSRGKAQNQQLLEIAPGEGTMGGGKEFPTFAPTFPANRPGHAIRNTPNYYDLQSAGQGLAHRGMGLYQPAASNYVELAPYGDSGKAGGKIKLWRQRDEEAERKFYR
jgi:hypothetical protein